MDDVISPKLTDPLARYTEFVYHNSRFFHQRPGQYILNHIPTPAAQTIINANIPGLDIWESEMTWYQIYEWLDNHLILDNGSVIAVFNGDDILWELSSDKETT